MSLNIKNPEAHELASELARLTGESLTKAVTEAIRERLERERARREKAQRLTELKAIAARAASHGWHGEESVEEFLYDERGLPR